MSKNLTRKGLALGAVVALGATLFAGSPAFAANEINVAPSAGTSFNIAAGSQFTLATTFAPGFTPSSYAQLKYLVKTDANSTVKFAASKNNNGALATAVTAATAQAISTTSSAVSGTIDAATDVSYLGLSAVTTSASSSVEVTAFVDANNDGALTAGEWNTVKTVSFKTAAAITPVVTLAQPSTGDLSVSATVAWGDLNVEQMSTEAVKFTVAGGSVTAGTYTSSTGIWALSGSALASAAVVTAQAYNDTVALGTVVSATATARTVSSITANVVKGADAIATSATTGASSTAAVVRANGTFVASVKALDNATTPVAAPAVAVKATVAVSNATLAALSSSNTTEVSITVNGTKYTDATALAAASVALTTDASGVASVTVSTTGFTAGSSTVTVTFAAQNFTSAVVATSTAAAYHVSNDATDAASSIVATNKNTAVALAYSVKDQFGTLSARTNERLVVTATNVATQYIAVSAGKAAFSVTPSTDTVADVTVASSIEISTNNNGTITWATGGSDSVTNTLKIRSAAYSFTVAPAIDATNGINNGAWTVLGAQKQTLTSYDQTDATLTTGLVAPAASTVWAKVTLTGSNAGEKLTASGTGVYLSIDGATATKDSASHVAQTAAAVVYVASTTAGAKTITVSNGSVSATVVVTFAPAVTAAAYSISLGDLAAVSQAGRSVDVVAIVTDKFGNPVVGATAVLSSTGVGYLANTTTPSNAAGQISGKLIVGALENGDAVVTATLTLADATTKTVSKTVSFGATDAQIDAVNNRVTAVASFAKGKTVAFYVDGVKKWSKLSASDADVVINYNLKKGTHTVAVKISGGFSTVEKFIVK
jgi:hypothetical protein